jgi:hypothetical protein
MNAMSPLDWLRRSGAQGDVLHGLAQFSDWSTLWSDCPRGDWLLGIATRLGVPHDALVRAAIACARIADGDAAAREVLDVAERWSTGLASEDDVRTATKRLEDASAAYVDPSVEAAGRAALAVGLGVVDRDVLTGAPAAAAESVIVASIDCGFELAMRWAHDRCAAAVRAAVPWSMAAPCVERLGATD